MDTKQLNEIWEELKTQSETMQQLIVRNTGTPGLSIAFDPISNSNKILLRVEEEWSEGMFPNWTGLHFHRNSSKSQFLYRTLCLN